MAEEDVAAGSARITDSTFDDVSEGDAENQRRHNATMQHPPTLIRVASADVILRAAESARSLLANDGLDFQPEVRFHNHASMGAASAVDKKHDGLAHKRKLALDATTTTPAKLEANRLLFTGIFELCYVIVDALRDELCWGDFEAEDVHVLDQASATTRYNWHQDKHNGASDSGVSVTVVVDRTEGDARSSFLWRSTGDDVCVEYDAVGAAVCFSSMGFHATGPATAATDKVLKLTYFFRSTRRAKRQRRLL